MFRKGSCLKGDVCEYAMRFLSAGLNRVRMGPIVDAVSASSLNFFFPLQLSDISLSGKLIETLNLDFAKFSWVAAMENRAALNMAMRMGFSDLGAIDGPFE
ncbi:hypothetical protein Vadar_027647 [Vaccinium darrowii]|uniref:Uncharacterized protein n=1 Tax=Vaccinium darrowii TaxID=229202 RepID=A0ACB7YS95_9ERIC|nr:hypothetical protein Vadar_027647 [Vaccinium darrowii]